MATGGRERQDSSGDQGALGGHVSQPEQRAPGGGESDVLGRAPMLHPHSGRVHDRTDDVDYATHATRMSSGLRSEKQGKHRIKSSLELVYPDSKGKKDSGMSICSM